MCKHAYKGGSGLLFIELIYLLGCLSNSLPFKSTCSQRLPLRWGCGLFGGVNMWLSSAMLWILSSHQKSTLDDWSSAWCYWDQLKSVKSRGLSAHWQHGVGWNDSPWTCSHHEASSFVRPYVYFLDSVEEQGQRNRTNQKDRTRYKC